MVDTVRSRFPESMHQAAHSSQAGDLESLALDAVERVRKYAREEPISFGLWALGIGFVLGWKLKPW
ncbi:hypothetical protein TA3x_001380 [Tundrisphaera sp. TA3]|uniref:hypothetical protein n=1 Tax=Tundrisphaera sp. TA3 TaxID=3435775 RepID=UPI003EB9A056